MKLMRNYPSETVIEGETYRFERIVKEDLWSVNVLYRNDDGKGYILKLTDARTAPALVLRPVLMLLLRREYNIYGMLTDLDGIPKLGPCYGRMGYFHEYVEGKSLHDVSSGDELQDDFFDRLISTFNKLHERRIIHLDMQKRGNVIVAEDGSPYLIDFQLCIHFKLRSGPLGRWSDRLFRTLMPEVLYHVYKQKKHFQPHLMTDEEKKLAQRTELNRKFEHYLFGWGRKVKRAIYPKRSNETIWFKWKKLKDKSPRVT